jgi:hypothetical protein
MRYEGITYFAKVARVKCPAWIALCPICNGYYIRRDSLSPKSGDGFEGATIVGYVEILGSQGQPVKLHGAQQ